MQLGATLFYKAQFDVESADERYDSLDTVIDDIRAWLRHKRYGFFYVDFETQQRTPKASAYWFKRVAQNHCL